MFAPIIQLTELAIIKDNLNTARNVWQELVPDNNTIQLYEQLDSPTLLELRAYPTWPNLYDTAPERQELWESLAQYAEGDFRRELLTYIEEPKPTNTPLPDTANLELRHVEVRPPKYDDYRAWRERTIFDVVRASPEVSTFSAYHTVFSTRPGVLFLSGFNGSPNDYLHVFSSARYRQIVQAAGKNYITGGNQGLATRIFRLVRST
ncbi:hypothetical protein [Actinomyces oricola]